MNALDKLKERAADLEFELPDGTPVVKLGLTTTLYFKRGYTAELKKEVIECFDRFYDEFQPHLKCQIGARFQKLTSARFEKYRDSMLMSDPNEQLEWQLSSAGNVKEAGEFSLSVLGSFEVHGDKVNSYLKLVLPWTWLVEEEKYKSYEQWLNYLCNKVEADHGYSGLSIILPHDYHSYMPTEYQLAQQYSGLEVDSMPHLSSLELIDCIKGVNWNTILGNTYVERLGGEAAVRHALSGRGDIEVLNYDYGLIIRAGQYPELGAVEDGPPPAYVAVNKVVKPVRIPNPDQLHSYSPYGDCFDEGSTALWYARFDKDDEQTTPASILAGQPCPKAGYWFTTARPNSRRHFRQGEPMPAIDESSWGATLWYWSGEDNA